MSLQLQVIMGSLSILTYLYIIRKIRKSNAKIDDLIIWILGALVFFGLSVFPSFPINVSKFLGFESTSNLIFFIIIGFLYVMNFLLNIKVSKLEDKCTKLIQHIALVEMKGDDFDE